MLRNLKFDYTEDEIEKMGELRKLINDDVELEVGTEDVLLSKFLYFKQWNVSEAYQSVRDFYDFKQRHQGWLAQKPFAEYREFFLSNQAQFVIPKPDRENRVVVICKVIDAFDKYPNYLMKSIELDDLIFESLFLLPQAQKYGFTIVYDLTNATINNARHFSLSLARFYNEKCKTLPVTALKVHYIRKGAIMRVVSVILKTCMNKKLKEQCFYHDVENLEKFHEMLGYDATPAVFGGPPENVLDTGILYDYILQNESYLNKITSYHKKSIKK